MVILLMLHTRDNQLVIFPGIALYYGNTSVYYLIFWLSQVSIIIPHVCIHNVEAYNNSCSNRQAIPAAILCVRTLTALPVDLTYELEKHTSNIKRDVRP